MRDPRGRPLKEHVLPSGARGRLARGIRSLRVKAGLTQEALAHAIDSSPSYVRRLERGVENPGLDVLTRLSDAFGVDITRLFPRERARRSRS